MHKPQEHSLYPQNILIMFLCRVDWAMSNLEHWLLSPTQPQQDFSHPLADMVQGQWVGKQFFWSSALLPHQLCSFPLNQVQNIPPTSPESSTDAPSPSCHVLPGP